MEFPSTLIAAPRVPRLEETFGLAVFVTYFLQSTL